MPFTVEPAGQIDLSPSLPSVTFAAGQIAGVSCLFQLKCMSSLCVLPQSIMLTAVRDNSPELNETFIVRLGDPVGGGSLNNSQVAAEVTILENQDPFGVLQIITSDRLAHELACRDYYYKHR